MATIRIGDTEVPARVTGELDSEVTVEMLPTSEVLDFIVQAVPGAAAVITIAGTEYPGRVRITDMSDYVTTVEF
jgi:ATP:corrinoid adenosyltransferase